MKTLIANKKIAIKENILRNSTIKNGEQHAINVI